ncbi:hypothetical protein A3L04_08510 [Thermococcus chitonophagus]|uniref:Uncharacterized protein n=1 Tax=Thermococcus chitonophagus TaxID=54262 RepID=A0A160VS89_9EURY|nr:hypothetical protein [Thermococcus chitonophagus]ASJ17107.1 hypothetical protein A3L04_08510 [Thermococcus chitonophagus]CUX77712.1 hypothetical protein CHITON_0933 [Thermococcus chitonophagus]
MKRLELSEDIFLEVYDLRSYNNDVIRESINAMFKIAEELRGKVVLVGGWSVYYWVDNVLGYSGVPSIDIDFLAKAESFEEIREVMKNLGFQSAGFRFAKPIKSLIVREEVKVDFLFDEKPSQLSFDTPFASSIFRNRYYSRVHFEVRDFNKNLIAGGEVDVAFPEAVLALKFDIYTNLGDYPDDKRDKHWKDIIDIYSLVMGFYKKRNAWREKDFYLRKDVLRELYKAKNYKPTSIYEVLKRTQYKEDIRVMLADYVGFKVFEEKLFERKLRELETIIKS